MTRPVEVVVGVEGDRVTLVIRDKESGTEDNRILLGPATANRVAMDLERMAQVVEEGEE
jgi:hypothetical protein